MFDGILELAVMHLRYAQNTVSVIIYETILWLSIVLLLFYEKWDSNFRISFLAMLHVMVTSNGMIQDLDFS